MSYLARLVIALSGVKISHLWQKNILVLVYFFLVLPTVVIGQKLKEKTATKHK